MTEKTKIKLTFVVTVEYDANPVNYPEGQRDEASMLKIDLANADEDPYLYLDQGKWEITGEVVK